MTSDDEWAYCTEHVPIVDVRDQLRSALEPDALEPIEAPEGYPAPAETWDDMSDWIDEQIIRPIKAEVCKAIGHNPVRDHCGKPEHDLCSMCGVRTPGQAPGRKT